MLTGGIPDRNAAGQEGCKKGGMLTGGMHDDRVMLNRSDVHQKDQELNWIK